MAVNGIDLGHKLVVWSLRLHAGNTFDPRAEQSNFAVINMAVGLNATISP